MSLQVWLPLDGNLKNLGCKNITVTNSGATIDNNGKIGKCYSFDGTSLSFLNPLSSPCSTFSVCGWIKLNTGYNNNYGFHILSFYEKYGRICISKDGYAVRVLLNNNGVNQPSNSIALDSSILVNEWNHYAITLNVNILKIYINGELNATRTLGINGITFSGSTAYIGSHETESCKGCLNDFRLYDHCLSAQEVKKISQGLVIHYPLNNNGRGKSNLILRVTPGGGNDPSNISSRGNGTYINDYSLIIQGKNSDTYFSLWTPIDLINNNIYTLSAFVEGLKEGTSYSFSLYAENNTSMGVFIINKNGWNSFTFVENYNNSITGTYNNITVYRILMDDSSRTIASGQGSFTIKAIKLEEGNVRTPFVPHVSSSQYANFKLGDNIEADISGYGRNGIKNNITYNYLTKVKYGKSAMFNGTNSYIKCNTNNWMVQGAETISYSFWACEDSWNNSGTRQLLSCTQNGGFSCVFNNSTITFYLHVYTNADKTSTTYPGALQTLTHNFSYGWHHFVFTYKKQSYAKIYVDGILFKSINLSSSYGVHYNTSARLFLGCQASTASPASPYFNGKMSDFRFYVTQLSEEDVKDLYNYNKPEYYLEEDQWEE